MSRRTSGFWTILILGIVIVGGIWWTRRGPANGKSEAVQSVPVVAAIVRQGSFTVYRSQPGTVEPANSVTVRSQVDGILKSVAFKGGQMVKRGDLLAEIDPRSFQAQLQLANGDLERSRVQLANAQETLRHYETLLSQNSISRQRVADQQSLVRQYAAEVNSAKGRIGSADLQVSNARITSPISGMVGLRRVDPGNLVGPSDPRGIVVVNQSQPSKVVFSMPVDVVARVLDRLHGGACIPVEAYGDGADDELGHGRLLAANNQVDPATGTVKFEAEFANANGALLPNRFVTAKLPVEVLPRAILVSVAAIQQGAKGAFVYVIKDDSTVAIEPVKVEAGDVTTAVINAGISPGAKVVVEGADRLRAGTKVVATMTTAEAVSASEASAPDCEDGATHVPPQAPNARS